MKKYQTKETANFKVKVQELLIEIRKTGKLFIPTSKAKRVANDIYKAEQLDADND